MARKRIRKIFTISEEISDWLKKTSEKTGLKMSTIVESELMKHSASLAVSGSSNG